MSDGAQAGKPAKPGLFGSLKEALAAASRDDTALAAARRETPAAAQAPAAADHATPAPAPSPAPQATPEPLSAAEAAREARGVTSLQAPNVAERPAQSPSDHHVEFDGVNTTRIARGGSKPPPAQKEQEAQQEVDEPARTQLVRGRQPLKRGQFTQDPVVGWLVIVGGPGLGSYRPVFEGNNTIGRGSHNRIPLDHGDEAISTEEQAYLRYDSADRIFLFVPNLSKTNIVQVNNKKPTSAVVLAAMDVIVMGRTQLVFMPFCGPEFDWSEITESKD